MYYNGDEMPKNTEQTHETEGDETEIVTLRMPKALVKKLALKDFPLLLYHRVLHSDTTNDYRTCEHSQRLPKTHCRRC
jgi:hypothetical protein